MDFEHTAFLGLGTNIGDRFNNLKQAIELLKSDSLIEVTVVSSIYESHPLGPKEQQNFYNCVIGVSTNFDVEELLRYCKIIEQRLGRQDRGKWQQREIDIDILCYDNSIFNSEMIIIPHPGLPSRDFVLIPLKDIYADFIHPVTHKTIDQMISELQDRFIFFKIEQQIFA